MSLHTLHHQGLHKPRSGTTFMLNSHWGRAATGKKKRRRSLVFMHAESLQSCLTLQPCRLWPARLPCQRRGSPGNNTGAYWPILVAIGFLEHCISCYPSHQPPLSTWCCQNPCDPSSCTISTPGPHRGKPKPSRVV